MPFVQITLSPGAVAESARQQLVDSVHNAVVAVEGEALRMGIAVSLIESALPMPNCVAFAAVSLIDRALAADQRQAMAHGVAEAIATQVGTDKRMGVWAVVEQSVASGEWSIGGLPLTIEGVMQMKRGEKSLGRQEEKLMQATVDIYRDTGKHVLMVASNPAIQPSTNSPIGFWCAELVHPYWEFQLAGYEVDIVSPEGGEIKPDSWSHPLDPSRYSAEDFLSLGFLQHPDYAAKLANTRSLYEVDPSHYDALFLVGGQGPMVTFYHDERLHKYVADFYETGKATCIICHATSTLLKIRLSNGELLCKGKSWTGYAASEEAIADQFVGFALQPFRIEDEARKIAGTNYIAQGAFRSFAVRDGNLITGQQQHSGAAAARLVIEAIGR